MRPVFQKCYSRRGEMTAKSSNKFMTLRVTPACSQHALPLPICSGPLGAPQPSHFDSPGGGCGTAREDAPLAARVLPVAAAEFRNNSRSSASRSKFAFAGALRNHLVEKFIAVSWRSLVSTALHKHCRRCIGRDRSVLRNQRAPQLPFASIRRKSFRSRRVRASDAAILPRNTSCCFAYYVQCS